MSAVLLSVIFNRQLPVYYLKKKVTFSILVQNHYAIQGFSTYSPYTWMFVT